MTHRKIANTVQGNNAIDGAGVHLVRVLGLRTVKSYDPFLMLDIFDSDNPDDYVKGFPWHPHRGIETLTYLIEGEIEHGDSLGNSGKIGPGDCQWMRAGSGIIHQEMPLAAPKMKGFQLWLNMPAANKMDDPKYHDLLAEQIGRYEDSEKTVRVIGGRWNDVPGAMEGDYYPVNVFDIELRPNAEFRADIDADDNVFLYIFDGGLEFPDGQQVAARRAILTTHAAQLSVKAVGEDTRFILYSGPRLDEPVHWGGPIVMSTKEDLDLAFRELDEGTFIKHAGK
ncbi:MAG: pirin family protein [Fastidiosipilaceae bacterium]|jgi:redox-sensitive bicupin YhaK (pirin superfamily)